MTLVKMTGFGLNDKGEELKMTDLGLIMFVITSQSTGW
jgi:hypothetical protein